MPPLTTPSAQESAQPIDATFPRVGAGDHVVESGECMASIGFVYGFFWETLWELPENAELRRIRGDPNVLMPGDRVFVPPLRVKAVEAALDQRHQFRRRGVPEKLRIQFLDAEREPRAGVPFVADMAGQIREGETDDDGCVEFLVSPVQVRARMVLLDPKTRQVVDCYEFDIGQLPPIESDQGVAARLANIGLFNAGQPLSQAIEDFQRQQDLDLSGEADDATLAKLREVAGS